MGSPDEEKTPAGRYLKARMEQVGYRRKVDLAMAANVSPSTITRLFSVSTYRPDVENTRRLATALQVGPDELIAGMSGEARTPAEAPALHPLAAELGRMLADDSPLTESTKALQELLVDRAIDPARRQMRPAVVLVEDPHTKALIDAWKEQGEPVAPVRVEHDDDPDPIDAKLARLETAALTLNPADLRRLNANVQTLIEWAMSRGGLPEPTDDEIAANEGMQRFARDQGRRQRAHERGEVPAVVEQRR